MIFTQDTLQPSFILCALHRRSFLKHPLFTVDEVCNISNKYQPLSNLAKSTFTQKTLYLSFISKKNGALHRKRLSKHPLFTSFSLFLTESEVCIISNKY